MTEQNVLSVTQLNQRIKLLIDGDPLLSGVCVRGELSNYKIYPSGHHYFTLKDADSSLRCVMLNTAIYDCAGPVAVRYPRGGESDQKPFFVKGKPDITIAAYGIMADRHFVIEKAERDGRTYTSVTPLDGEGRKRELARLHGGDNITATTLASAAEQLAAAEKYKGAIR